MYTCEPTDQQHLYDLRPPRKLMALILNSSFKFLTSVLVCLPFTCGNFVLPTANEQTFSIFIPTVLPACRRLLFPLLHAEKGHLRNAVANRVPASRWQGILFGINCEIISG